MLTQERADMLSKYLENDIERTKKLFELDAAEAAKEINKDGYDFSEQELAEYGEIIKPYLVKGEIDESDLENVAGGIVITAGTIAGLAACGLGGVAVGVIGRGISRYW